MACLLFPAEQAIWARTTSQPEEKERDLIVSVYKLALVSFFMNFLSMILKYVKGGGTS
jgi:hypothetical protein